MARATTPTMSTKTILRYMGYDELTDFDLWQSVLAEFVGTLFLVLIGCGTVVSTSDVVPISLAFGLTVILMLFCIGDVSGGHLNPSVTLGTLVTGKIFVIRAFLYMIFQVLGAVVAAGILKLLVPSDHGVKTLGVTSPSVKTTSAEALGYEFLMTFLLVFTVCAVRDPHRTDFKMAAPVVIGMTTIVCHLFAVTMTGASMNPARSFGPAAFSGIWTAHWVYWVGPIFGGIFGALFYHFVFRQTAPPSSVTVSSAFSKENY